MSAEGGFFHQRQEDNDYGTDNQAGDYGSTVTQEGYGGDYDNQEGSYKKAGNYGSAVNDEGYGGDYRNNQDTTGYDEQVSKENTLQDAQENADEYGRHEHLGEAGALAAGAYALYERHEAKEDPENADRHTIEEEVGAVTALGAGGYAFHEHHQKEEAEDEVENEEGKNKSSWFG